MRQRWRRFRTARINFAIAVTQDDSDVFRCSGVSHSPICSYRGFALTGGIPASNPGSVIGEHVGSYRILETISSGGMGTVYRAEHTLIGKIAAVKILHPELSSNRDIVNRFFNEAKATTSIKHPGIVEVFDFGYMASGHAYLIMEFLEGMPLSHRMRKRGAVHEGEAALLMRGVCIALAAAHAKGVVHRDLKPDNIFVVPDHESALGERTKILDFGIAKLTDPGLAAGSATRTGAVMGTPTYMSPEQCRGTGEVDLRADLYSIGCILYELVTGRPPFTHAGAGELIAAHLFLAPEPLARFTPGLSQETEALIMALLAKQPEHRVQSANDLAQHLTQIAQRHGWMMAGGQSASLPRLAGPHAMTQAVAMPTPMGGTGPATPPPVFTPIGSERPGAMAPIAAAAQPSIAPKPTTLSGSASQVAPATMNRPGRSNKVLGLGLLLAGAAVVTGVAFVVLNRSDDSTRAAAAPAALAPPAAAPAAPSAVPPAAA
ncbi:MAG TPA: serine/threonine-protein kinase, partial [Kofleriaceae bacterium]